MLARVFDLSRFAQLLEKRDCPKGLPVARLARCGMDPARSLDKRAALLLRAAELENPIGSLGLFEFGLNGLVEGVGLDVLGMRPGGGPPSRPKPGAGGRPNLDGNVPALARPLIGVELAELSDCDC